ncbi:MAG: dynamin family protein [Lamprocystis purpurea]|jgi:hypothetical protein|uniref:dynamin family protein n=1 Tax=Lamprocystis purpurea TaxID=61598 RepID=UPI00035E7A84|nr:dynamin family protein [Lamprocystis purpurea]MBV5274110.1 dynamin family protein [Lamprocystis purpurea]
MQTPALQRRLATYQHWKLRVTRAIQDLETWLAAHRRATPPAREHLRAAHEAVSQDRLRVALVGESARGKTELINSLFSANLGARLLPSAAGRTTRCPTELLWDDQYDEAYLRLLPVETRALDTPLAALRSDPKHWVHYPLDDAHPEQLAGIVAEILLTKTVSMGEAARLGLSSVAQVPVGQPATANVEIAKWRYAVLSFPHPLLKQGLVILDIPGVDVLDSEPDITGSVLSSVQAVLFVLAADTGVTRGDLAIWQHHLQGFQGGRQRAMLVVLNKIDALGGAPHDLAQQDDLIAARRRDTAQALGIGEDAVFPVSARQALAATDGKDEMLLRRSALPALERHLATKMLETKHQSLIDVIDASVGQVLDRNRARIASRISRVKSQLEELEQLRDKSHDVIAQLLDRTRREQERYLKGLQQFQQSREELLIQTRECRRLLEVENIEAMIDRAQRDLTGSWTTAGLTAAMKRLFDELRRTMQSIATESERIRRLVRETYQIFREGFGFDLVMPKVFLPMKYRVEIELLYQEMDGFRRSPRMILVPRGMVTRHFNQRLVSRAQVLFDQLRVAFDGWIRDSLQPLAEEIQDHKQMMEKRLENLQRIGRSKDALQKRIDDMQTQYVGFAQELTALRNIHNALHYDPLTEQEAPQRPRLVCG